MPEPLVAAVVCSSGSAVVVGRFGDGLPRVHGAGSGERTGDGCPAPAGSAGLTWTLLTVETGQKRRSRLAERAISGDGRARQGVGCLNDRPQFRAELTRHAGDIAVVTLEGEIDLYTAPEFREVLLRGIDEGARRVIVDLSSVTFVDSTALGVLVGGGKRLRLHDGALLIVCGLDGIRRILEVAGLAGVFAVHGTLEEALAAAG
jgi:anti-sigma B factor antagonist